MKQKEAGVTVPATFVEAAGVRFAQSRLGSGSGSLSQYPDWFVHDASRFFGNA
jgi:hypothetical protein